MTKRFLALLLAIIMVAVLFAGCKKTGGEQQNNVSVIYETDYEYEYVDENGSAITPNDEIVDENDKNTQTEDNSSSEKEDDASSSKGDKDDKTSSNEKDNNDKTSSSNKDGKNDKNSSSNKNDKTSSTKSDKTSSSSKVDKNDKTSSSSKVNQSDKASSSSKENNNSSDKTNSNSGADTNTENSNTNKTGFPIVKKQETISVMTQHLSTNGDYKNTQFTKEYEEMTNMKIDWQLAPENAIRSKVTLALQAGTLPDIIFCTLDDADMLRYSKEGNFVEITKDLLKEWAPNIYATYNENPEAWEKTVASDGKMWTIAGFSKDWNYAQHYLWVRTTWLKNLGLEKPKTMEDFYNMLKAFKNSDPNGNGTQDEIPFATWHHGGFIFNPWGFTNAIDVSTKGKVTNMYTTKNMKDAVTYWAKIYKEDLVDKKTIDNYTGGSMTPLKTLIKQGKVGSFFLGFPEEDTSLLKEYEIIPYPTSGDNGDFPTVGISVNPVTDKGRILITKKCKNVTAALRWLDYLYTDEGYMLRTNGSEGGYYKKTSATTYELTGAEKPDNAGPSWTLRGKDYLSKYVITNASESDKSYITAQRKIQDNWCAETLKTNNQKFLPETWKNQSEINAENLYSSYWNEVKGMWWSFVQGKKNMGADWTTLINDMNTKGVNKYIAELQKYYDRCN